jgi:NAD-dependent DNA ligase
MEVITTAFGIGLVIGYLAGGFNSSDDTDHIDQLLEEELQAAQDRYAATPIDDEEQLAFEIMILERPGTERIMREAVDVDGVGPETALAVAKHFEGDYHEFREADVDALQEVNGVGENRARALTR